MAKQSEKTSSLEEQAMVIAGEIFSLIDQYTHDSNVSKFFLTDDIAKVCYGLAGGFAAVIYTPPLEPEETKDTAILSFIYALMTYGFNMYLKERSLTTNAAPYTLPTNLPFIKKVQEQTLTKASAGKLFATPLAEKIVGILITNITNQLHMEEFEILRHELNQEKFMDYTRLSLYWGYNFAQELLAEKKRKPSSKQPKKQK
jgi:hypothetical protein